MHGALGREATRVRHIEGLHDYALTGKSRIAMNIDRQHQVSILVAIAILT